VTRVEIMTNQGPKQVLLRVTPNEIMGARGGRVFFSQSGCEGDSFVFPITVDADAFSPVFEIAIVAVLGDKRLLHFPTDSEAAETPFLSQVNTDQTICFNAFGTALVVPAIEGDPDLHSTFLPLFFLEEK